MTLQHATAGQAPALLLPPQGCSRESGRADPPSPGYARQRGGGAPRLRGSSYLLLRRPRTCQGVSPSLSSFSSITRSNAGCRMPHPCGAAASRARCRERGDVAAGGAGGKGRACPPSLPPSLPQLRQGAASPHRASGGREGCCIGAGVAWGALRPTGCRARVQPPGKRGDTKEN